MCRAHPACMSKQSTDSADELARARLAYVNIGQRPLTAPRHAAAEYADEEPAAAAPPGIADSTEKAAPVPEQPQSIAPWLQRLALSRTHVIALAVLLCIAGIVLAVTLSKSQATQVAAMPAISPSHAAASPPQHSNDLPASASGATTEHPSPAPSPSPQASIRVHVAGAVTSPGVVNLRPGAIVVDAIDAAGGLTSKAVPGDLNLAAPVSDGMQVKVGIKGEESHVVGAQTGPSTGVAPTAGSAPNDGSTTSGQVNLNTASTAELEELPGIGPVTAQAIIAWRDEHGSFTSTSELQEISGIGPKTFAKLEPHVTV